MANVYDSANQMAKDLQTTQQFLDLKQAFDMLKLDTVAFALFQQFQQKQMELQQKQMQGQEFSQDDIQSLQDLGQKMQDIEPIQALMAKEQALSQMMDELNQIISEPIVGIYRGTDAQ